MRQVAARTATTNVDATSVTTRARLEIGRCSVPCRNPRRCAPGSRCRRHCTRNLAQETRCTPRPPISRREFVHSAQIRPSMAWRAQHPEFQPGLVRSRRGRFSCRIRRFYGWRSHRRPPRRRNRARNRSPPRIRCLRRCPKPPPRSAPPESSAQSPSAANWSTLRKRCSRSSTTRRRSRRRCGLRALLLPGSRACAGHDRGRPIRATAIPRTLAWAKRCRRRRTALLRPRRARRHQGSLLPAAPPEMEAALPAALRGLAGADGRPAFGGATVATALDTQRSSCERRARRRAATAADVLRRCRRRPRRPPCRRRRRSHRRRREHALDVTMARLDAPLRVAGARAPLHSAVLDRARRGQGGGDARMVHLLLRRARPAAAARGRRRSRRWRWSRARLTPPSVVLARAGGAEVEEEFHALLESAAGVEHRCQLWPKRCQREAARAVQSRRCAERRSAALRRGRRRARRCGVLHAAGRPALAALVSASAAARPNGGPMREAVVIDE